MQAICGKSLTNVHIEDFLKIEDCEGGESSYVQLNMVLKI
jgi:hypothetical protein